MLDVEIRSHLIEYLLGRFSLDQLQEWLAVHTWDVHQTGLRFAQELAYTLQHRIAEYSNGDWSEDELKDLLRPLASVFEVDASGCLISSSSSDEVVLRAPTPRVVAVGTDTQSSTASA
jgi:hypothetical protein